MLCSGRQWRSRRWSRVLSFFLADGHVSVKAHPYWYPLGSHQQSHSSSCWLCSQCSTGCCSLSCGASLPHAGWKSLPNLLTAGYTQRPWLASEFWVTLVASLRSQWAEGPQHSGYLPWFTPQKQTSSTSIEICSSEAWTPGFQKMTML